MKKIIISTLVGSIILFMWGFISWVVIPVHFQSYKYTPAQEAILKTIADGNLESGAYMIPGTDNREGSFYDSKYRDAMKANHESMAGKPMATLFYVKEGMTDDPMHMLTGFLIQLVSALCVSLILAASSGKVNSFSSRWWLVMLIAVVISCEGPLMGLNWLGQPWHHVKGLVFDLIVSWGLCGAWMSWYFGRE